jgi:circadian clock protein KaiC
MPNRRRRASSTMRASGRPRGESRELAKSPTGIPGLDEITLGGLPKGRTTLVTGGAGSGKTLLGIEFLVQGVRQFGEPGVLIAFEETPADLTENVRSLGVDLERLIARGQIAIDHVHLERSEIQETGEYDLEGLFVRLGHAIDSVGAKRVVIDTLEVLFAGLADPGILRAELRRLFRWLKERGVTAIVTAERGPVVDGGSLTRHGLEEFVSDCVILLDHRVAAQMTTRRLRIVKYRGSTHGSNEYPFLIDADGITVLPVTSLGLRHKASSARISSGTAALDDMLGGRGFFRGSSILVSGTAGSGKTTVAATLVEAACRRGEHALYFALEESPAQIQRNMHSVGIDLERCVRSGRLRFHAARPTSYGFETHLTELHRAIREFRPAVVIVDPVTSLASIGSTLEVQSMLTRLIDHLKSEGITGLFTALTQSSAEAEHSDVGVSSLMDTWIPAQSRERWRAKPRLVRAEIAGHGAFEPNPRVPPERTWNCPSLRYTSAAAVSLPELRARARRQARVPRPRAVPRPGRASGANSSTSDERSRPKWRRCSWHSMRRQRSSRPSLPRRTGASAH